MIKNPFEKFTKEAKIALQLAEDEAKKVNLHYIGTEHLLLGILSVPQSLGCSILLGMGVNYENVKIVLKAAGQKGDNVLVNSQISTYLAKVIEDAVRIAAKFKHNFVGTEHLLHALVTNRKCAASVVLDNMQVSTSELKHHIEKIFNQVASVNDKKSNVPKGLEDFLSGLTGVLAGVIPPHEQERRKHLSRKINTKNKKQEKESTTPALDFFGQNLIEECLKGKMDPVIGRTQEIKRVVQVLNRKTKNNPVLIGEPGVGKTAIV